MTLDSRFLVATKDSTSARQMLNEIHQQIAGTQDKNRLTELLARYVALATSGRSSAQVLARSAAQAETFAQMSTMLSNISKQMHDNAKAIIANMRA